MSLPTIYQPCRQRADVLEDRVRDEDLPVDLSQLLKGIPELKEACKVEGLGDHKLLLVKGAAYWLGMAMDPKNPCRELAALRLLLRPS